MHQIVTKYSVHFFFIWAIYNPFVLPIWTYLYSRRSEFFKTLFNPSENGPPTNFDANKIVISEEFCGDGEKISAHLCNIGYGYYTTVGSCMLYLWWLSICCSFSDAVFVCVFMWMVRLWSYHPYRRAWNIVCLEGIIFYEIMKSIRAARVLVPVNKKNKKANKKRE